MSKLILEPNSTAQWHTLISKAQSQARIDLDHELESYLVFLLMRFVEQPEMAAEPMAIEYLRSEQAEGTTRKHLLQEVGDKCLILSGLFPGRAEKRRVCISYFINLGRTAYASLGQEQDCFQTICAAFVELMDVLQATREETQLTPLQAEALWRKVGSQQAADQIESLGSHLTMLQVNLSHNKH